MERLKPTVNAEGIPTGQHLFFCPGCKGVHGVKDTIWDITGTPERPTVRASVLVHAWEGTDTHPGQPRCHSFITDGRIEFLSDSTHELAGQTVDLPPFDDWFK
ncbi:hypothetical protein F5984_13270 [Rudanella paleaurantiibacter]|uniref:Ammonia monooxygenase n=1 Tax=Rudanella paleaurantiibacter TaxID=2614655 RepID=A0A7J5TYX1_9BACT|nr:DUF6527 family protein [Rudanella paleaurantiibacter]KAB7730147.1 hypothetical protein F5984_13270 [Rudanella paleaurantiibacter]